MTIEERILSAKNLTQLIVSFSLAQKETCEALKDNDKISQAQSTLERYSDLKSLISDRFISSVSQAHHREESEIFIRGVITALEIKNEFA